MNSPEDTIAAISTPRGEAAICIIRISGNRSTTILERIFRPVEGTASAFQENRKVVVGFVVNPESEQIIDKAQAVLFRNPKTYTGEDMVEIYGHGGLLISEKILEAVLSAGARPAERGEFTLRAFLNGKMNLAEAEAVLDVITAKNEKFLSQSIKNLDGALKNELFPIQNELHSLLARIEVDIEYPDEGFELPSHAEIFHLAADMIKTLKSLTGSFCITKTLKDGIRVALVGAPNVGKSSIMNRLLEKDRVIVHPSPGTTRDLVSDNINIGGIDVAIVDTAGLAETDDPVEMEGIRRAMDFSEKADILFYVMDASAPIESQFASAKKAQKSAKNVYFVLNKIDIAPTPIQIVEDKIITTSALTGYGIERLNEALKVEVEEKTKYAADSVAVNKRQYDRLSEAVEALNRIMATTDDVPIDILSADLHTAARNIGQIFGENASINVLHQIFDNFCVGK